MLGRGGEGGLVGGWLVVGSWASVRVVILWFGYIGGDRYYVLPLLTNVRCSVPMSRSYQALTMPPRAAK